MPDQIVHLEYIPLHHITTFPPNQPSPSECAESRLPFPPHLLGKPKYKTPTKTGKKEIGI